MARKVKRLKYAREHSKCGSMCTVKKWKEKVIAKAYRLTVGQKPKKSDFLPTAIVDPSRNFGTKPKQCSAFALSFFTTINKAKRRRDAVAKTSSYFKNKLHYVSETRIQKSDGRVSHVNSYGHFGVHEYLNNDLLIHAKKATKITS